MFSDSSEFYDAVYGFKDYAAEARRLAELVRSSNPDGRHLLDVACGTGAHIHHLRERHGFIVAGLDISHGMVCLARSKCPSATLLQADMSCFSLLRRYDVITCLFSSIGYLVTTSHLHRAVACFKRHLANGGLLIVEAAPPLGTYDTHRVFVESVTYDGTHITRVSRSRTEGGLCKLLFDYTVVSANSVRHLSETHTIGVFTHEDIRGAFERAGFSAEFDPIGLSGRGLWLAR